jgi:peptide-methionine (S)-S-oxide reductase
MSFITKILLVLSLAVAIACSVAKSSTETKAEAATPNSPAAEEPVAAKGQQIAVFAGGCFWGVDAVFKHVKGVIDVKSGYAGGDAKTAQYERVGEGNTGHAESVQVKFDPEKVTYAQLLTVFFTVAHDPTELNRQGPDTGTQYRSAIFYTDEDQKKAAQAYIDSLEKSKAYSKSIVTQVVPLTKFYQAEAYHQNYLALHPTQPYIVYNDIPKVEALKAKFPDLYVEK